MGVWFRNKNTGVEWEVDGELERRLSESPDFERVKVEAPMPKEAAETHVSDEAPRRRPGRPKGDNKED